MVHHRYIPPFLHVVPSLLPHFNFIIHTRATRIIFLDIIFTSFHIVIISWKTPLNITRSFLARTVKLARVRIVPLFFSRPFVDECHARRAQPKSAATPSPNSLEHWSHTQVLSRARNALIYVPTRWPTNASRGCVAQRPRTSQPRGIYATCTCGRGTPSCFSREGSDVLTGLPFDAS